MVQFMKIIFTNYYLIKLSFCPLALSGQASSECRLRHEIPTVLLIRRDASPDIGMTIASEFLCTFASLR
jgi:hypothetical protein